MKTNSNEIFYLLSEVKNSGFMASMSMIYIDIKESKIMSKTMQSYYAKLGFLAKFMFSLTLALSCVCV